MRNIELMAHMPMWDDRTHFHMREVCKDRLSYAKPIEFVEVDEGQLVESLFTLKPENTQALFNQLWQLGFRPKDGTGNSGHVGSIERHLEDMRTLAFAKLKVAKP